MLILLSVAKTLHSTHYRLDAVSEWERERENVTIESMRSILFGVEYQQ